MFDKTVINESGGDRLVPYAKTVHEHKAPTVESAKYLEELSETAFKNVLGSIRTSMCLGGAQYPQLGISMHVNPGVLSLTVAVHDGKEVISTFDVHPRWDDRPEETGLKIIDQIKAEIANKIVFENFDSIMEEMTGVSKFLR